MTEDEETMIRGQVVKDLANAKQELQRLISQRDSVTAVLKKAIDILNNERRILNLTVPADQMAFPTAPEIVAIVSDIGDVRSKIVGLDSRMKEFGI